MFHSIDEGTYYFFRFQKRNNLAALEPLMDLGRCLGFWLVAVALALVAGCLLYFQGRRLAARLALFSLLAALLCVRGLEIALARPRPFDAENLVGPENMTGGFPSRPVFLTTLAWTLLLLAVLPTLQARWLRFVTVVLVALLVCWVIVAQLYFALYYLTDILAGLAGGLGLGLLCWHFSRNKESSP